MGSCYSSKATEQTRKRSESSLKTLQQQSGSNQKKSKSPRISSEKHLASSCKVADEEGAKSESASITLYDNNSDNSISEINLLNQLELIHLVNENEINTEQFELAQANTEQDHNYILYANAIMSNHNQAINASLNRFGFKITTANKTPSNKSENNLSQSTMSDKLTVQNTTSLPFKKINATFEELTLNENSSKVVPNDLLPNRNKSPSRSFLKPPTSFMSSTSKKESLSLSSLSSSSSISNQQRMNDLPSGHKTKSQIPNTSDKTSAANKSRIPAGVSSSKATKTNNENVETVKNEPAQVSVNGMNKKRLFSPYKLNIVQTQPSSPRSADTKPQNAIQNEPSPKSTLKSNSTNHTNKSQMSQLNNLNKLKFNQMPNIISLSSQSNNDNKSLMNKKKDSAYCSSSSSTASSQEVNAKSSNEHQDFQIEPLMSQPNRLVLVSNQTNSEHNVKQSEPTASKPGKPLIKDSLGELNHLMMRSTEFSDENSHLQKRGSIISLSTNPLIQFKPPTNLKPIENGETVQLDIETYRSLLQDIQNTKIILYKLANILREPHLVNSVLNENGDLHEPDDKDNGNSLISSFYNNSSGGNHLEKVHQSTQTE